LLYVSDCHTCADALGHVCCEEVIASGFVIEERIEGVEGIAGSALVFWRDIEDVEAAYFLELDSRHVCYFLVLVVVLGKHFDGWNLQVFFAASIVKLIESQSIYAF